MCIDNVGKGEKYHVSIWGGKKWQCCRAPTRIAEGCEPCSVWNKTPPNSPIIKNGENNSPILGKCFYFICAWYNLIRSPFFCITNYHPGGTKLEISIQFALKFLQIKCELLFF